MKKKKTTPCPAPLELVKEFEKVYVGCYQVCDKLIEKSKRDINWWNKVYIPIAATNAIMEQYGSRWEGTALHTLYSWRQSKQILEFDKTLLDEILETPEPSTIPIEAFDSIPFNALYIDLNNIKLDTDYYLGFFITFDEEEPGNRELRITAITPDKEMIPLYLPLKKDCTIQDSISESRGMQKVSEISLKELFDISGLLAKFVNIIVYICCKNADIAENPIQKTYTRKPSRPNLIKDVSREIQKWDVGWRVGAQLRQSRQNVSMKNVNDETVSHGKTGSPKRPHMRSGHYHSFWTGKRKSTDRKLIVKWIPPMQINVDANNELITTIRKVK